MAATFCFALIAGCGSQSIDPYETFNITRTVDFTLPQRLPISADTSSASLGTISIPADYSQYSTSASELRTAEATRVYLHAADPSFTLDHLVYARLLIGTDTIAFDSIPQFTGDSYVLTSTNVDITRYLSDTTFPATLQFKLNKALPSTETITAGITIVHTAKTL